MSKTGQSVGIVTLISQLDKCYSSSQSLFKLLVQIRTDVVKDSDGIQLLREKGGLNRILKLLNKPNEKILNVVLSILANCCLQEECRDVAVSNGIIPLIIPILKNLNQDSIQSRSCRLIGNLAQNYKIAEKIHEHHIIPLLVTVLNSSSSDSTLQMAIRALRLLWEVPKQRIEMVKAEAIQAVSVHLASKDKDVKTAVMKALATFTKGLKSYQIAKQVLGGRPDLSLMVADIGSTQANLCLYNLSCLDLTRVRLIQDGLIEGLVAKLNVNIEHWMVMIFCQLCQDSTGRERVRGCQGGLALILRLLRSSENKIIQAKALVLLNFYLYDRTSLKILVMNGLVPLLIKSLAEYVVRHGRVHDRSGTAPDTPAMSPLSPCSSGLSPHSITAGGWSPLSEDCSPPQSPAISIYSPLCLSEDELDPTPVQPDDDVNMSAEEKKIEEEAGEVNEEETILKFLNHVANYLSCPIADLAAKLTIMTLIDYISLVRDVNPFAVRLLCTIAGNKNYYRQLLDDQFVLTVHWRLCRPSHEQCAECDRIAYQGTQVLAEVSRLAQTGLGEGEMSYRLLKSDEPVKLHVSLTIPHVINERDLLLKLLFKRKAIEYLMEGLESRREDAVSSLHALFKTLQVKTPQHPIAICTHCDVGSMRKENTVTFLLDDGSTVSANKETLCNKSPVFEAMFRGGFKESEQSEVKLTDISADCVSHFSRIVDTYCECILPKNIGTLLELIVASDRFLVPELATRITSVVMNHGLNYKTLWVAYDWSLDKGFKYPLLGNIASDIVKFALVAPMTQSQRVEAVTLLMSGNHKREFLEDILEIIKFELFY